MGPRLHPGSDWHLHDRPCQVAGLGRWEALGNQLAGPCRCLSASARPQGLEVMTHREAVGWAATGVLVGVGHWQGQWWVVQGVPSLPMHSSSLLMHAFTEWSY